MNERVVLLDSVRVDKALPESPFQKNKRLVPGLDPQVVELVFERARRVGGQGLSRMVYRGANRFEATIKEVSTRVSNF